MFYHPPAGEVGYFIEPEERGHESTLISQEVMISLPWFYPDPRTTDLCAVAGVVNIGSRQRDSGLVALVDAPEEVAAATLDRLVELTAETRSAIFGLLKTQSGG